MNAHDYSQYLLVIHYFMHNILTFTMTIYIYDKYWWVNEDASLLIHVLGNGKLEHIINEDVP